MPNCRQSEWLHVAPFVFVAAVATSTSTFACYCLCRVEILGYCTFVPPLLSVGWVAVCWAEVRGGNIAPLLGVTWCCFVLLFWHICALVSTHSPPLLFSSFRCWSFGWHAGVFCGDAAVACAGLLLQCCSASGVSAVFALLSLRRLRLSPPLEVAVMKG